MNLLKTLVIVGVITGLFLCFSSTRSFAGTDSFDNILSKSERISAMDRDIIVKESYISALEASRSLLRFNSQDTPADAKRMNEDIESTNKTIDKETRALRALETAREEMLESDPVLALPLDDHLFYEYLVDSAFSTDQKECMYRTAQSIVDIETAEQEKTKKEILAQEESRRQLELAKAEKARQNLKMELLKQLGEKSNYADAPDKPSRLPSDFYKDLMKIEN
jgi:hypothetical protein